MAQFLKPTLGQALCGLKQCYVHTQLKQSKDESIKIINECKTENEMIEKLNSLKKKNIKRSFLLFVVRNI